MAKGSFRLAAAKSILHWGMQQTVAETGTVSNISQLNQSPHAGATNAIRCS